MPMHGLPVDVDKRRMVYLQQPVGWTLTVMSVTLTSIQTMKKNAPRIRNQDTDKENGL